MAGLIGIGTALHKALAERAPVRPHVVDPQVMRASDPMKYRRRGKGERKTNGWGKLR